jgi:pseudouridine-5'-phosphate glycosidase/pseudouridine kinase
MDITDTHWQLGMSNGALFAVPIPAEYEAAGSTIQEAVEQAVRESEEQHIFNLGKEVTPWLLKRVGELTQGKSLASSQYWTFLDVTRLLTYDFRRGTRREYCTRW